MDTCGDCCFIIYGFTLFNSEHSTHWKVLDAEYDRPRPERRRFSENGAINFQREITISMLDILSGLNRQICRETIGYFWATLDLRLSVHYKLESLDDIGLDGCAGIRKIDNTQ